MGVGKKNEHFLEFRLLYLNHLKIVSYFALGLKIIIFLHMLFFIKNFHISVVKIQKIYIYPPNILFFKQILLIFWYVTYIQIIPIQTSKFF